MSSTTNNRLEGEQANPTDQANLVNQADNAVERYRSVGAAAPLAGPIEIGDEAATASTPFIGRWRTLVSTTNWEKGRIIGEWRGALEAAGAGAGECSDEAWAQLVGGVTGQHVGRLRRVHQRFGGVYREYEGLYWSHFQAASEWDDAEMWLEGGVQNGWSVSQMRAKRWETVGGGKPDPQADAPERDEVMEEAPAPAPGAAVGEHAAVDAPFEEPSTAKGPADGDDAPASAERRDRSESDDDGFDPAEQAERGEAAEAVRPFAELPELPDDIADAFEQFKLAILAHKLSGWADVSRDDLLGVLESLKQLATAPSADE